jgi:8-oxo-dGTP pyrophosphatase MutT (NUDIX family)
VADEDEVRDGPAAAGIALVALDTGRVLMLQRELISGEPSGGKWEFPGGRLDAGEAPFEGAAREFAEEVGHPLPEGRVAATWLSEDGVYQGFVWLAAGEDSVPILERGDGARAVANPDDPAGNSTEAVAWFDPRDLDRGPRILREECRATPWSLIKRSGGLVADAGIDWEEIEGQLALAGFSIVGAADGDRRPHSVKLSTGWAFPIPDVDHLRRAVKAYGRAKEGDRAAVRRHIISRARALGASELIPESWRSMTASAEEFDSLVASLRVPASALLPEHDLPGPTPWTVDDDGLTADGHLALWASCHIGYPGCVRPPREDSFDFFNLGDAVTADGRHVPVGKVTVGTGHAGPDLSWRTASAHYDESGTAVAVGHAVADRWGIRLPSVIVASATPEQVDEARRSPLSGDWRRVNGQLRLVAALGVNVPGYPVPRALVAGGEVASMFVGFDLEAAAEMQAEADALADGLGLGHGHRAAALRASLLS